MKRLFAVFLMLLLLLTMTACGALENRPRKQKQRMIILMQTSRLHWFHKQ